MGPRGDDGEAARLETPLLEKRADLEVLTGTLDGRKIVVLRAATEKSAEHFVMEPAEAVALSRWLVKAASD